MDLILVAFIAGLTFGGWRSGFIHRLFGLLFMAVAFVVGAYLRGPFGDLANSVFKDIPPDYASLVGYTFAFPVILAVLHIATYPIVHRIQPQGLTKELDRALGALFGFIEATLILSAVVVILDTYFVGGEAAGNRPGINYITDLAASFNASVTVHLLRETTVPLVLALLGPLLPKDISTLVPGGVPGLPGIPGLPAFQTPTPTR
jgi:membrane protein required for colicin V production